MRERKPLTHDRILACAKMAARGIRYFGGDRTIDKEELVGMCIQKILEHPHWDTESKAVVFARRAVTVRLMDSVQCLTRTTNRSLRRYSVYGVPHHDRGFARADARMDCETILGRAGLDERELRVCRGLAFGDSYSEMADRMGCCTSRVGQLVARIRRKCRTNHQRFGT